MRFRFLRASPACAKRSGRASKPRPISAAPCRVCPSIVAGRAISPRSAMDWRRRKPSRKSGGGRAPAAGACRGARGHRRSRPNLGDPVAAGARRLPAAQPPRRRLCPPGYDAALDEFRALRDESRGVIAALQARYSDVAGTKQLKLKHNHFLGYFIEVSASAWRTPPEAAA